MKRSGPPKDSAVVRERGQVVDVFRTAGTEEGLQQGVEEHTRAKDVFKAIQRLFTAGVMKKRRSVRSPLTGVRVAQTGFRTFAYVQRSVKPCLVRSRAALNRDRWFWIATVMVSSTICAASRSLRRFAMC